MMDPKYEALWEDVLSNELRLLEIDFRRVVSGREGLYNDPNTTQYFESGAPSAHPFYKLDPERARKLAAKVWNLRQVRAFDKINVVEKSFLAMKHKRLSTLMGRRFRQVFKRIPKGGCIVEPEIGKPLSLELHAEKSWSHGCRYPQVTSSYVLRCDPYVLKVQDGWLTDGVRKFQQASRGHRILRAVC